MPHTKQACYLQEQNITKRMSCVPTIMVIFRKNARSGTINYALLRLVYCPNILFMQYKLPWMNLYDCQHDTYYKHIHAVLPLALAWTFSLNDDIAVYPFIFTDCQPKNSTMFVYVIYQFKECLTPDSCNFALYASSSSALQDLRSGCRNADLKRWTDLASGVFSHSLMSKSLLPEERLFPLFSSWSNWESVGTLVGSKLSQSWGSIGTQTRPVFGWMQNGAFSKWFICFDTSMSRRG